MKSRKEQYLARCQGAMDKSRNREQWPLGKRLVTKTGKKKERPNGINRP